MNHNEPANMKIIPQVGKWYLIRYGFSVPKAQCVAVTENGYLMSFYWGLPWRELVFIDRFRDIYCEIPDPRWIPRLLRFLTFLK